MIEFNFLMLNIMLLVCTVPLRFVGVADQGKDIVFRSIIKYRSLRDFGPSIIGLFLNQDF
jgi:hypothetical protein